MHTLGEPAPTSVLAARVRHCIEDRLNDWDSDENARTAENAGAIAGLAVAHRALATDPAAPHDVRVTPAAPPAEPKRRLRRAA